MTSRHKDSERFHQLLTELGALHDRKQTDYGTPDSPFANLESTAGFGVEPWLGALVRLNDKVSRLKTYARTHKLANEGVADSLQDIAVYALAALVLFEKGQPVIVKEAGTCNSSLVTASPYLHDLCIPPTQVRTVPYDPLSCP